MLTLYGRLRRVVLLGVFRAQVFGSRVCGLRSSISDVLGASDSTPATNI